MSNIFTSGGKTGDFLLQYPVAYQWSKKSGEKITLWLDAGTLRPLESLLAAQEVVESVEFKPGIQNYTCGGQPWDFGLKTDDFLGHRLVHLGFRQFPQRQITLQTALDTGLDIDMEALVTEPCLKVPPLDENPYGRYAVLHGTFQTHMSGVPRFWKFFRSMHEELAGLVDSIVFTGTKDERDRALELYPQYRGFDDQGDFLQLARLMSGAVLVIGAGSSGVALGGALKVPTIRVHDPIGEAPKTTWSNLGANQWNEPETALRSLWPEIKAKVLAEALTT